MEDKIKIIGESLYRFQSAINESGYSLEDFIRQNYANKWISDELFHASAIRTTMVNSMTQFLVSEGLLNLEKVMMSIITDPLAHDIEYTPNIQYKGHTYLTTHSMIYSKFMACSNPRLKGIYVDSPNIRLEMESSQHEQRGKYLADFSQIDIELRRNRGLTMEDYYHRQKQVTDILNADMDRVKNFFERMIRFACEEINRINADDLRKLGVVIEVPELPFPSFEKDECVDKYGSKHYEEGCGENTKGQFFWITGLLRENYDLVYPYMLPGNGKVPKNDIKSSTVFNYDIVAKTIDAKTGKHLPGKEILSGAIREWLYEPIIERLIDNKILAVRPLLKNGNIENIDELGGYGPFLFFASMTDESGKNLFPDTMGGGIGIERTLFALLRGEKIAKIDDLTFFGKNPDSHPLFLF
jgi:aspartyl/asparaginyl-tRNA synthetase